MLPPKRNLVMIPKTLVIEHNRYINLVTGETEYKTRHQSGRQIEPNPRFKAR